MKEITIRIPDPNLKNITILVVLLAGLIFTWRYSQVSTEPEHVHKESEAGPGDKVTLTQEAKANAKIEIITVQSKPLSEWLDITGVVEPDLSSVVHIRPMAKGVVRQIMVKPGDRVSAGQILFQYDNIEVGELVNEHRGLVSEERKLAARESYTLQAAERAKRMLDAEAMSRRDWELRVAEHQEAKAELDVHRSKIALVEQKLRRYEITPDRAPRSSGSAITVVRAPQAGTVLDYSLAPGESLTPEQDVMTLTNMARVWVIAAVYEKDLTRIKTGESGQITVSGLPERVFFGKVTQISDRLDSETRTGQVKLEIDNRAGNLKLQMFCNVRIPARDPRIAPAIPDTSLQQIDGKDTVFVQLQADTFQKRDVQLGHRAQGWVEVLGGVSVGERVVSKGSFYLKSTFLKEMLAEEH